MTSSNWADRPPLLKETKGYKEKLHEALVLYAPIIIVFFCFFPLATIHLHLPIFLSSPPCSIMWEVFFPIVISATPPCCLFVLMAPSSSFRNDDRHIEPSHHPCVSLPSSFSIIISLFSSLHMLMLQLLVANCFHLPIFIFPYPFISFGKVPIFPIIILQLFACFLSIVSPWWPSSLYPLSLCFLDPVAPGCDVVSSGKLILI